jgi:hypothetical protein
MSDLTIAGLPPAPSRPRRRPSTAGRAADDLLGSDGTMTVLFDAASGHTSRMPQAWVSLTAPCH